MTLLKSGEIQRIYLGIGTNYYGRLALHDTVRLMSECDLYIGMDGGLMHFCSIYSYALLYYFWMYLP